MPDATSRWGLSIMGPGDTLAADGYKFSDADIHLLDRLLLYAAEQHHHTGETGYDTTPTVAPALSLLPTSGAFPSASRLYYRYTIVDDLRNESAPSPISSIDTPAAVATPGAPSPNYMTGAGSLLPGNYHYVVSAYKGTNTQETKALNSATITIPGSSTNNQVTLILPSLPYGADGLNIYRRTMSGMHYLYLASVAAPVTGDIWVDDGTIEGDCDRGLPATNRTSNTAAIKVTYPSDTTGLPDGWAWRLYRSTSPLDWSRSFLIDLTPMGVPLTTPTDFTDVGGGTETGGPPTVAQVINAPSKIKLTDAAEVEGELPPGTVVTPHTITFTAPGPVTVGPGTHVWVCDYDQADIVGCRAYLGVDSTPEVDDVIVDVNLLRPGVEGTWVSAYDDGVDRPTVPVGQNVGDPTVPLHQHLVAGDAVSVDVDQAGGGAGTDQNLTVNVLLVVKYGSETDSYDWQSS